jgi:sugar phosphate isomerase/epimerase
MAIAGGLMGLGMCCSGVDKKTDATSVGIQLYTLRDLMQDDYAGTVKKVAQIGYDAVEFAGYGEYSAKEIKALLDDTGLRCAGTHEGFEKLQNQLDETIEFNLEIGSTYIVCPAMPEEWRNGGADSYLAFGEKLNGIGESVKKSGLQLCYHNHAFEFEKAEDKYLIDHLFESMDADLVKAEVDVYWVAKAGVDPAAFIQRYAGRCPLLHMKDMAEKDGTFAPVGTGVLDFPQIIEAGREAGVVWHIVEQDRTERPALEAIQISLKNMKALLRG